MTGSERGHRVGEDERLARESFDDGSVHKIDTYLERAVEAEDGAEKDFHVRHARQLLEACREQ